MINEPLIKTLDEYIGLVYSYNAQSEILNDPSFDSLLLVVSSGSKSEYQKEFA